MNVLNVKSIMYIGFRLAPFILISFFALSALFNSDIKGIIFLAMLLLNCFITIAIGVSLPDDTIDQKNPNMICNSFTLTRNEPLSKLPLNINVITFTFAYLAYIIGVNGAARNNIPTFTVFPIFILYQLYWSWINGCNSLLYSFISFVIGAGLGVMFSYAIDKSGIVQLQYFNGITKQDVCVRATNAKYKCSTKPNVS